MIKPIMWNKNLRFCKVIKGTKAPFEKEWVKKPYTWAGIKDWVDGGNNYGVIGGYGNLIIVDFDNEELQTKLTSKLPETFTVKTGGGLLHKYFFSKDGKTDSFKLLDKNKNTLADIQGTGKQVVGPGSIHPNGRKYEIVDDKPIAEIDYSELRALFSPFMPDEELAEIKHKPISGTDAELIKQNLTVPALLSHYNINTNRNPTRCPLHDSKGGKCLSFTQDVWKCFHCDEGGDIFTLYEKKENCTFKEAIKGLSEIAGVQLEKEINIEELPNLDTLPIRGKIISLILERKRDEATELAVDYIKGKNYIYSIRDDVKQEVWIYNDGVYIPHGKSYIKEEIRNLFGPAYSTHLKNTIIEKIETDTFIEKDLFFQNRYVNEVPVMNGILNLDTRELTEFNPNKIFFNKLPLHYDKNAVCPAIDKHLHDVLVGESDVGLMYELFGFVLFKEYFIEKVVMMLGNGRNGKGKTIDLIKRFIGVDNCASVPLNALNEDSFRISELFGKMANLAGDLPPAALKDTSILKQSSGRDLLGVKRKFLTDMKFINYACHIFACNELPRSYDIKDGFWDRWIIFKFPNKFVGTEEYANKPDVPNSNLRLLDPCHIDKISSQSELNGLLNKALDGLDMVRKNRGFSYSKTTEEIKNVWIRNSDSFAAFCMDHLESASNYEDYITKLKLRKSFHHYCKYHNLRGQSDKAIKYGLEEQFGATDAQLSGENMLRVWQGIKFKNSSRYNYDGHLAQN